MAFNQPANGTFLHGDAIFRLYTPLISGHIPARGQSVPIPTNKRTNRTDAASTPGLTPTGPQPVKPVKPKVKTSRPGWLGGWT